MLPNRMNLPKQTEEKLRRLKQNTGINPNTAARIAFFRSFESGFVYAAGPLKLDGGLILDKVTWLGETLPYAELLLSDRYPDLEQKDLAFAWAAHVVDGSANFSTARDLSQVLKMIAS